MFGEEEADDVHDDDDHDCTAGRHVRGKKNKKFSSHFPILDRRFPSKLIFFSTTDTTGSMIYMK